MSGISEHNSWARNLVAVVCLVALLSVAGVQAMHTHSDPSRTLNGTLDAHCALCLVSHCVLSPGHTFVLALPARVLLHARTPRPPQVLRTRLFQWFVRPPPLA